MNETIFVVFIILIIVVLGFVAYSRFHEISIREEQRLYRRLQIIEMAHRLSSWSELECSVATTADFVCLDVSRLMVLGTFINKSRQEDSYAFNYYFDLLRDSRITVTEIYPSRTKTLGEDYWILYDNPGETLTIDKVAVPVNLYNPLTKNNALGVMELFIYE